MSPPIRHQQEERPDLQYDNHRTSDSSSSSSIRLPPFDHSLSEDEKVVHGFLEIIQTKVEQGILTFLEPLEKKMILQPILYPAFYIGSLTSITTFIFLRKAPLYIMNQYIIPYYYHPSSIFAQVANHKRRSPFKESTVLKPFSILLDTIMSTLLGISVGIWFVDKAKIYQTIEDIPLIAGKSQLSNALCTDFISYYKTIPKSFWVQNEDDILTTITHVIENCKKRQAYEKQLLQTTQQQEHEFLTRNETILGIRPKPQDDDAEKNNGSSPISLPNAVPYDILQQVSMDDTEEEEERFQIKELEEIMDWAEVDDYEE